MSLDPSPHVDLTDVSAGFLRELAAVREWARRCGDGRVAVLAAMLLVEIEGRPAVRSFRPTSPGRSFGRAGSRDGVTPFRPTGQR
jgi:hypothetical protein